MDDHKPFIVLKTEPYDAGYSDHVEIEEGPIFDNKFKVPANTSAVECQRVDIIHVAANETEIIKEEPDFYEENAIHRVDDNYFAPGKKTSTQEALKQKSLTRKATTQKSPASTHTGCFLSKSTISIKKRQRHQALANRLKSVDAKKDTEEPCDTEREGNQGKTKSRPKKTKSTASSSSSTQYECYMCKTAMTLKKNLHRHFNERHIAGKVFECKICKQKFPRQQTLIQHKSVHTRSKHFECKYCKRSFAQKGNLTMHNYSCGPSTKPIDSIEHFDCKYCKRSFTQITSLRRHMHFCDRSETGKKVDASFKRLRLANLGKSRAFECYLCKFACDIDGMRKHMAQHAPQSKFNCIICVAGFDRSEHLAKHMKIHTHNKRFQCNTCSKKFTRKRNLKRHQRLHTKNELFKCGTCEKKFTTKYALQIHERNHTGAKPFACSMCDERFARNDYLKNHIRRVHK